MFTQEAFLYQRIGLEADTMRRLGMSFRAIGAALGVAPFRGWRPDPSCSCLQIRRNHNPFIDKVVPLPDQARREGFVLNSDTGLKVACLTTVREIGRGNQRVLAVDDNAFGVKTHEASLLGGSGVEVDHWSWPRKWPHQLEKQCHDGVASLDWFCQRFQR